MVCVAVEPACGSVRAERKTSSLANFFFFFFAFKPVSQGF